MAAVAAAAAAVAGLSAAPANALLGGLIGGSCSGSGTQVFAPWGDFASYYLIPNGGFESGSGGWKLSGGASISSGNEPFLPTGSHSLSLPSGSSATSPVTCIGPKNEYLRLFGSDVGGTDSGVRVRVLWYGLLNNLVGSSDFATFAPGGPWSPTGLVESGSGFNLILPILGSTSARIQITPLGSGSSWIVDDVYLDPYMGR